MNVLFISPFKLGTQHGLYNAVWNLAISLVAIGNKVTILRAGKLPSQRDIHKAREQEIALEGYPFPRWWNFWRDEGGYLRQFLERLQPDIVHIHYVRVPKYYAISRILHKMKIPFVVSLHGGMNPAEMKRRYIRKIIYWTFIERSVHLRAAGIHFITERERLSYYQHFGRPSTYSIIPNVIHIHENIKWKGEISVDRLKFLFLGRYDIWTKGIDLSVELVRVLREQYGILAELHLYGSPGDKFRKQFQKLLRKYSGVPIIDHGLISGEIDKLRLMSEYDFYLQYSRFEVFGMSIGEALSIGMPVIVSENCDLSQDLSKANACITISMEPSRAAQQIAELLDKKDLILTIANNGRKWVSANCSSQVVAAKMIDFYKQAIAKKKGAVE